jgi:hypothetical protein
LAKSRQASASATNDSNNKPWWKSKTKVGLLISGIFAIAAIIMSQFNLSSWGGTVEKVGVVVGGIIFGWGVRDTPFINGQ